GVLVAGATVQAEREPGEPADEPAAQLGPGVQFAVQRLGAARELLGVLAGDDDGSGQAVCEGVRAAPQAAGLGRPFGFGAVESAGLALRFGDGHGCDLAGCRAGASGARPL